MEIKDKNQQNYYRRSNYNNQPEDTTTKNSEVFQSKLPYTIDLSFCDIPHVHYVLNSKVCDIQQLCK